MRHAHRSSAVRLASIALGIAASVFATLASAQTVLSQTTIGGGPRVVAVNPVNNKVYIARHGAGNVRVMNVATGATNDVTLGFGAPTSLAVDPVTADVFVGGEGTAALIDGNTDALVLVPGGFGAVVQFNLGAGQIFNGPPFGTNVAATIAAAVMNPPAGTSYLIDPANGEAYPFAFSGLFPASLNSVPCGGPVAVNPTSGKVYVANTCGASLTIPVGPEPYPTIGLADNPTALAVNPVTNTIYVALAGTSGVAVIDGSTGTVTATIGTGTDFSSPTAVAVNPVTNKIYVANSATNDVVVIDGATNGMTHVTVDADPVAISVDNVRNRIYVANKDGGSVTVINGDTLATTPISVSAAPNSIAVNPVTSRVYVVDEANGVLSTIDGREFTSSGTVTVSNATEAAVDPFRDRAFFASINSVAVAIRHSETLGPTIGVGSPVGHIAVDPLSGNLFAVTPSAGAVAAISPSNVLTSISVGGTPGAIALNPATQRVYVGNFASGAGRVEVIDAKTSSSLGPFAVGAIDPVDLAVDAAHNRVYVADGSSPSTSEVIYADGSTGALSGGAADAAIRVAANPATGRVYILRASEVDEYDGAGPTPAFVTSYAISGSVDLAVNSVTNHVYVANGTTTLSVIDPVARTVGTATLSDTASAVSLDELADRVYASTPSAVFVVDGETATVTGQATVAHAPAKAAIDSAAGKAWVPIPSGTSALVVKVANAQESLKERFTSPLLSSASHIVTSVARPTFTTTLAAGSNYSPNDPGGIVARSGADDLYGSSVEGVDNGGTYSLGVPQSLAPGLHFLTLFATDNMSGTVTNSQTGTGGTTGGLNYYVSAVGTAPFVVVDPPSITTASPMADGTEGIAYAQSVTASGGTGGNAFTITSGALPDGLSIDSATGAISGTPTLAGTYNFTSTVTDDSGGNSAAALAITVVEGTPQIVRSPTSSLAFATTVVGQSSTGQSVTLSNPGWGHLAFASIALTSGAADYTISANTCTTSLTHNQTCSFTVAFSPSTSGARPGNVRINSSDPLNPTVDIPLTGTGTPNAFTLTATSDGTGTGAIVSSPAGINCPGDCSEPYTNGTMVTLTATPSAGSAFSQWSGCDSVIGNQCTVTMGSGRLVSATFTALVTYTIVLEGYQEVAPYVQTDGTGGGTAVFDSFTGQITFNISYSGLSNNETDSHIYSAPRGANGVAIIPMSSGTTKTDAIHLSPSQQVQLAAGQLYVNIQTAAFPNGEIRGQIDNLGAASVKALAASKNGTGNGTVIGQSEAGGIIVCGLLCNANVPTGKSVTFTPQPASGSIFAGWGGACSGTGTCQVTMDAAKTVNATFNLASGPAIALTASARNVVTGGNVTFDATLSGGNGTPTGNVIFQDGHQPLATVPLGGGHAQFSTATLAAGSHDITIQYAGDGNYAAATSAVTTVNVFAPADMPRLGNISTRMDVLTGENVMIGGFIIGGSSSKTVAIVATGPSLAAFGIANPLANPSITLVRQSDHAVIAINDDWQTDANAAQLQAAGFAPSNPLESGLYVTLAPGAYTAIVSGVGGGTGVSLIAVYEVDHPEIPLINISTRGDVLTGGNVMIGGFIVNGSAPQTVAITASGPSLAAFGIASPLANPALTLVRQSDQAVIATNDDWQTDPNASELQAAGFAPSNPLEPGLLVTLPPGAYTAIVSGVGNTTGVSVIGVFTVP